MKKLDNLKPAPGSNKAKKRLGRGIGSGLGKTAGKGHKGQHARKGGKVRPGFEGGQMPLYRRLPKRGFKNPTRVEYAVLNLDALEHFEAGSLVGPSEFASVGLVKSSDVAIKLLANGTLTKALTVKVHKCSRMAREAVEKAGGKVEGV